MITLRQNKILAAVIFITAAFLYSFKELSCNKIDFKNVCAKRVIFYWEFYDLNENKILPFSNSMDYWAFNDRIVCSIPEEVISTNVLIDPNDNSVKDSSSKSEINYSYFLFNKDSSFGLKLDSKEQIIQKHVDKDSFFNSVLYKTLTPVSETDVLISRLIDKKNDEVTETFATKIKVDESYSDTTIIKYTLNASCFPYSLGKTNSVVGNQKVKSIYGIYNSTFSKEANKFIPRRIMLFKIEPITETIPDKVRRLFFYKL